MHDIIIVGAGTAGCVLADRLTASRRLQVLLVEAGEPPGDRFVKVPAGFARLFKGRHDWAFESEPQAAVHGRRIFTPRGKMLGGCANINAQVHQWCHPADFDGWVTAGAAGWGWDEVAPVLRELEACASDIPGDDRGRDGPMRVMPNRNVSPLTRAFVAAARAAGLGSQPRYNGVAYEGAWISEINQHRGRRFSAYDACLVPALKRPNLEVRVGSQALRIDFNGHRASGVTIGRGDGEESIEAGGVVLAAGAFASPQLLMLSGIGPADALAGLGIKVRLDVTEVGANLQDHPVLGLVYDTDSTATLKAAESLPNLLRFLLFGRGMLASNAIEAIAFTRSSLAEGDGPDLEVMFMPAEYRDQFLEPPRVHAFSIAPALVAPRSRGRVALTSPDPLARPSIDFALLSDDRGIDAARLCEGLRLCRRIAATAPLNKANLGELRPGPSVESDEQFLDYAARALQTVYHPTSTCRMGSDARSVVDPKLRLQGAEGLWVADASVMPSVPRGHPNAVVAMIAARAAGWVEADLAGSGAR